MHRLHNLVSLRSLRKSWGGCSGSLSNILRHISPTNPHATLHLDSGKDSFTSRGENLFTILGDTFSWDGNILISVGYVRYELRAQRHNGVVTQTVTSPELLGFRGKAWGRNHSLEATCMGTKA